MDLQPRSIFTIAWGVDDPSDSNTYYVQATIRNARTDALITTLNLEDKGENRFAKEWQVPADTSGQGFWIQIQIIVYTDSGYSIKSERYGRELREYLVYDSRRGRGGGGTTIVDYKQIRAMLDAAIGDKIKNIKIEAPILDMSPLDTAVKKLGMLQKQDMKTEKTEKIDVKAILAPAFTEVKKQLTELGRKIDDLPNSDPRQEINDTLAKIDSLTKTINKVDMTSNLKDAMAKIAELVKAIQAAEALIKDLLYVVQTATKQGGKTELPPAFAKIFKK